MLISLQMYSSVICTHTYVFYLSNLIVLLLLNLEGFFFYLDDKGTNQCFLLVFLWLIYLFICILDQFGIYSCIDTKNGYNFTFFQIAIHLSHCHLLKIPSLSEWPEMSLWSYFKLSYVLVISGHSPSHPSSLLCIIMYHYYTLHEFYSMF